jgi:hypothetical protein
MTTSGGRAAGRVDGYAPAAQSAATPVPSVSESAQFHRAHVMQKMKAGSMADLARIAERLEAHPTGQGSTFTRERGST